jgi:ABC-type sugar transport system substrate-binding protein
MNITRRVPRLVRGVVLPMALIAGLTVSATSGAAVRSHATIPNPTKAMCLHGKTYKVGYDVFSDSQPFAVSVSNSMKAAAKAVGCVTIIETVDNLNGPQAIANVKTLINEGITSFVDFQVLEPFQPAIAKLLKAAKIPAVTIVGATLPGYPSLGLSAFIGEKDAALASAAFAKKEHPGMVPYFLGEAEPASGSAVYARYRGMVAGIKHAFPGIPKSHIIEVDGQGVQTTAYSKALSALSLVPSGSLVMTQGTNDESTAGVFQAIKTRGFKNYVAEGFGGDSYGFSQVCSNKTHYAGDWSLAPETWGPIALSEVMMQQNGLKVPNNYEILGSQSTFSSLHCK